MNLHEVLPSFEIIVPEVPRHRAEEVLWGERLQVGEDSCKDSIDNGSAREYTLAR